MKSGWMRSARTTKSKDAADIKNKRGWPENAQLELSPWNVDFESAPTVGVSSWQ